MFGIATDPTAFGEYGPVWVLVGFLLTAIGWAGTQLIKKQNEVADAQVANLNKAGDAYSTVAAATSQAAARCAVVDQKIDVHSRVFENALSGLRQYASTKGDDEMRRHVEAVERELRSDLARIHTNDGEVL